ncbi:cysteine hydrolase family protein [Achromobacter xylosoxidans]|uniref:cysteine hydrolase family protein n=1 Tax=Alcaligenes xylosoxydans xylosoxydans TaxID=85698 RepID=UPI0006C50787|nr:isochorismatase family protein [Achromobacter xylosoxidans]QQE58271.1 isochorismatase family protein [Achromobacter xylosoxidans]QQV12018.1 isochorismatase family protein [Achromobacter xylosoxidans]UXL07875.1 isochorismatase family protein [Achromobacter xylosoxidans]CUI99048.1 Isochorismatase family protein yecD [Achromobacter xylosoxidans]
MHHPTIRTMAGATAPQSLTPGATALLVIDFQEEYFSGRMPIPDGLRALRNARRLVEHADRAGIAVIHVQHVLPPGSPLFPEDGPGSRFHPELQPAAGHDVVRKTQVSAFPGTDLHERLQAGGVGTVVVAGLMTHACVAGAARDAVPLGYQVIVAEDACATRDIDGREGVVPHATLHRATLAALDDTFADIMTTEQVLALPAKPASR